MNCVGHIHHGLWKHPRGNAVDNNKPDYWVELAQLIERGLFDNVLLADIVGVYDVLGDGIEVTAREAVQHEAGLSPGCGGAWPLRKPRKCKAAGRLLTRCSSGHFSHS